MYHKVGQANCHVLIKAYLKTSGSARMGRELGRSNVGNSKDYSLRAICHAGYLCAPARCCFRTSWLCLDHQGAVNDTLRSQVQVSVFMSSPRLRTSWLRWDQQRAMP